MLDRCINIEIAISDNKIDRYCHFCIFCNFIAEGLRFYVDVNLISALTNESKKVAAELGVSAATVSNAFNRPGQLSEKLRQRI